MGRGGARRTEPLPVVAAAEPPPADWEALAHDLFPDVAFLGPGSAPRRRGEVPFGRFVLVTQGSGQRSAHCYDSASAALARIAGLLDEPSGLEGLYDLLQPDRTRLSVHVSVRIPGRAQPTPAGSKRIRERASRFWASWASLWSSMHAQPARRSAYARRFMVIHMPPVAGIGPLRPAAGLAAVRYYDELGPAARFCGQRGFFTTQGYIHGVFDLANTDYARPLLRFIKANARVDGSNESAMIAVHR